MHDDPKLPTQTLASSLTNPRGGTTVHTMKTDPVAAALLRLRIAQAAMLAAVVQAVQLLRDVRTLRRPLGQGKPQRW